MGEEGDLLLVFADHLTRSWKQITKFRAAGKDAEPQPARAPLPAVPATAERLPEAPVLSLEGLIRDERGIRFAPEGED
jgi:cyanophycin synthetase